MRSAAMILGGLLVAIGLWLGTGGIGPVAAPGDPNAADAAVPPVATLDLHDPRVIDPSGRATAHPHGEQVCASGCAASRHPTPPLARKRFLVLRDAYAREPVAGGPALDELMFYGPQTLRLLEQEGPGALDDARVALIGEELKKTHALVEIRVVDEHGKVRVELPATRVLLDLRYEFDMTTHDLQPVLTSGTVKRVARDRVWQRL